MPGQTVGRFDLHDRPPVRYLAESPEHAVGEVLAPYRGTAFRPAYLRSSGLPLAVVDVTLSSSLIARIADLTDPAVLTEYQLRPDLLAHHERAATQAVARQLHDAPGSPLTLAGLRWWSALTGAWHTNVIFTDRVRPHDITYGEPRLLGARDPMVVRAMIALGITRR